MGKMYVQVFQRLGCTSVEVVHIKDRKQAAEKQTVKALKEAKGIFFTGGDQLRITGLLGGTIAEKIIQEAYHQKKIIAGTSAGASAMSDTMIIGGDTDTPEKDSIKMAPGLGLLGGAVIDQHFSQRGRIGRLLLAAAMNPLILGLGIDEDTAVHIRDNGVLTVLGRGTAMIVDASSTVMSNVCETGEQRPLYLSPVTLHVLSEGCIYSLTNRSMLNS